jgi:putative membrane protein
MVNLPIGEEDRTRIAAAVAKAEARSDGEIVTIIAPRSDSYHDVGLHYAILAMLLVPTAFAIVPQSWIDWGIGLFTGWNESLSFRLLMVVLLVKMVVTFLIVRYAFEWMKLRMALTPAHTKTRRVRRRALELFHVACEQRTRGRTGVLLYLSLLERRAEIVADETIHSRVKPEVWGESMHVLVEALKAGRPGEGVALAIEKMGDVLAECVPVTAGHDNELPDRPIEL